MITRRTSRAGFLKGLAAVFLTLSPLAAPGSQVETNGLAPSFSLREENGSWWLVAPDGRRFFSLGVCCVHQGATPATFDPENPGYGAWRHHATTPAWADSTLNRLKAWGFTTLGGWSDFQPLREASNPRLWMTPVLHIGSTAGAPWLDMWDPKIVGRMEQVARDQILPLRHDPRIIGYFSDNELGWWNAALWKMTLEQPPSSGQRRRLIRLLRETYWDDWAKLERDFESDEASSWKQLERRGRLFLKPGGRGIYAMRAFLGLIADRYYQLMHDIIRKYDPQAWFLGDRYQSFYYPEVVRASSRHVDISSSNLNAAWNDGTFPRFQLDTLHALAGKPVLVSEFYLAATENRSGNRNTAGIYPVVKTQSERAIAARNTLVALTQLPYVVGADWFQYFDEPRHGREDGENFNFGLVDIHNAPYEEITSMFRTLRPDDLKTRHRRTRPDAGGGVPPAPDDPFGDFTPTHALKNWDRERGFVRPASENALADLYLCWSADALYLGLYAIDIVEAAYYRNISVPKSDRALWTVASGGRELARARIGAGREAIVSEPTIRVECLSGLDTSVRNIAVMRLPAQLLGREQFKAGDMVGLECTLSTHCQAYRIEWKGTFHLRE